MWKMWISRLYFISSGKLLSYPQSYPQTPISKIEVL